MKTTKLLLALLTLLAFASMCGLFKGFRKVARCFGRHSQVARSSWTQRRLRQPGS